MDRREEEKLARTGEHQQCGYAGELRQRAERLWRRMAAAARDGCGGSGWLRQRGTARESCGGAGQLGRAAAARDSMGELRRDGEGNEEAARVRGTAVMADEKRTAMIVRLKDLDPLFTR
jgi:hypothetical protein